MGVNKPTNVANMWCQQLREKGYEHTFEKRDGKKTNKLSRLWRVVLKSVRLNNSPGSALSAFEVGCGGGKHLVQLALNNCRCMGIDCSKEVLNRAEMYIKKAQEASQRDLGIKLFCQDFLNFSYPKRFDMVFNVGVIEHYTEENERLNFLKKMFELARPGGYVVSVVPNGIHPLRCRMKTLHLGGYIIPEIDYTRDLMYHEFKNQGGQEIKIIPHNLFSYFLLEKRNTAVYSVKKLLFYILQLIPVFVFTSDFAFRHAGSLIGIARKPT